MQESFPGRGAGHAKALGWREKDRAGVETARMSLLKDATRWVNRQKTKPKQTKSHNSMLRLAQS